MAILLQKVIDQLLLLDATSIEVVEHHVRQSLDATVIETHLRVDGVDIGNVVIKAKREVELWLTSEDNNVKGILKEYHLI